MEEARARAEGAVAAASEARERAEGAVGAEAAMVTEAWAEAAMVMEAWAAAVGAIAWHRSFYCCCSMTSHYSFHHCSRGCKVASCRVG